MREKKIKSQPKPVVNQKRQKAFTNKVEIKIRNTMNFRLIPAGVGVFHMESRNGLGCICVLLVERDWNKPVSHY